MKAPYVFVSYSHTDKSLVMNELATLEKLGVNFWFDEGIKPGSEWREEIAQALANASWMIFFVSKNSVNSKHCLQEASFSHGQGIRILAIHLEPTELPLGLALSLGDQQAIFKDQIDEQQYTGKLISALDDLVTRSTVSTSSYSEIKQVTVLHSRFSIFHMQNKQIDPEDYQDVISLCKNAVSNITVDLEGYIAASGNEEFSICFGVPDAHEDDAERAVRAALHVKSALKELTVDIEKQYDLGVDVFQGVQLGKVIVKNELSGEYSIVGEVANDAKTLSNQLNKDEIAISSLVHRLVMRSFDCEQLGNLDENHPSQIAYRVDSRILEKDDEDNFGREKIVGRDSEIKFVLDRWQQVQNGMGQAVLLSGEPGIGKTRLTKTIAGVITQKDSVNIVQGSCSPYFKHTALYPFVEILERLLKFDSSDGAEEKLEKLEQCLSNSLFEQESPLRVLANFLKIANEIPSPPTTLERDKLLLLESILNICIQISQQTPMFMLIEDIHWADATTLEMLGSLLDFLESTHILCFLNFRSHFNPAWAARPNLGVIALSRVDDEQAREIVNCVLGDVDLDEKILGNIIARADGVPLFLEEVSRSLIDSGALLSGEQDLNIPVTLQESLTARLDLLKAEKKVAQIAAVIGRDFRLSLLSRLVPFDQRELATYLTILVRKEFLVQKGIGASTTYSFRHALIRDTAYGSIVKHEKSDYHRKIADLLAANALSQNTYQPEIIAYHFSACGDNEKAYDWWKQAGDKASRSFANQEAEHHYANALDCIADLKEGAEASELEILMLLVPTYVANRGYGASKLEQACSRALELCEQPDDDETTGFVLFGLWMFNVVRANHTQSVSLAKRVSKTGAKTKNQDLIIEGALAQGIAEFFIGEFEIAMNHFTTCLELYDKKLHDGHASTFGQDPRVISLSYISWVLWIQGDNEEALNAGNEALSYARALDHPVSLAFSLSYAGFLRLYLEDYDEVDDLADELIALNKLYSIGSLWVAHGKVIKAWCQGKVEDAVGSVKPMEEAIALFRETGSRCFLPLWDSIYAELLLKHGKTEEAAEVLGKTRAEMEETGEYWGISEWYRVQALSLQAAGKKDLAVQSFMEGSKLADRQGAKNWLERLKSSQGKM